ncbi:MAG: hypothetical protein WBC69_01915 [Geitlerinemataceae cyanobacterium]
MTPFSINWGKIGQFSTRARDGDTNFDVLPDIDHSAKTHQTIATTHSHNCSSSITIDLWKIVARFFPPFQGRSLPQDPPTHPPPESK